MPYDIMLITYLKVGQLSSVVSYSKYPWFSDYTELLVLWEGHLLHRKGFSYAIPET